MNDNQRAQKEHAYEMALERGEGHFLDRVNFRAYEERMNRKDYNQFRTLHEASKEENAKLFMPMYQKDGVS